MPEFRRQLLEAAASRAHEPGRRHSGFGLPRPRLGAPIAATASILVVVAVAAVVLTLGHGHHGTAAPGGQRNGNEVPGVAAARAQLLGELGALRRGHASKLAAHVALPESHLPIDRSLVRTRSDRGLPGDAPPRFPAVRGSASSHRTTGLVVTVQGPKVRSGFPAIGTGSVTVGGPVSPATIARHGSIVVVYVSGPLNRAVVIVPDGVTRAAVAI